MKVVGEVRLPISLNQAYEEYVREVRNPSRPIPNYEESVHKEVGVLEPGTIIKVTLTAKKTYDFYVEVIEHIPYKSFSTQGEGGNFRIEFFGDNSSSMFRVTETYHLNFSWASFTTILFSTRYLRRRHFFDANEWGHYYPHQALPAKYSCRIWGLPHHFVAVPLWIALFFGLSSLYEFVTSGT